MLHSDGALWTGDLATGDQVNGDYSGFVASKAIASFAVNATSSSAAADPVIVEGKLQLLLDDVVAQVSSVRAESMSLVGRRSSSAGVKEMSSVGQLLSSSVVF